MIPRFYPKPIGSIEMGPQAGAGGGHGDCPGHASRPLKQTLLPALGRSWRAKRSACDPRPPQSELFALGRIQLSTDAIHTVKPLDIEIPKGRLTVGHRGFRLRQDHPCAGKPGSRPERRYPRPKAAGACTLYCAGRHHPGQADRCRTHRHQCALHRGHLCQCA